MTLPSWTGADQPSNALVIPNILIVSGFVYHRAVVTGLSSGQLSAVCASKRRVDFSVDNQSRLLLSSLGAAEVARRVGQLLGVPRRLRTGRDESCGVRCVFVDDVRDGSVVGVNEPHVHV